MGFVPGKFPLSLLECLALTSGTFVLDDLPRQAFLYLLWAYVRTHDGMHAPFQLFASLPPTSAGVVEEVLILEFLKVVHGNTLFFQQG
jgi:hypothetical protein